MQINIRPLHAEDGNTILDIHRKSFPDPWENIQSLLHLHSTVGWIAIHIDKPVGFILWQLVHGEGDVLSFAVLPEYRNQGIGKKLYKASETAFFSQGILQLFLEVSQENNTAIDFYQSQGFVKTGVRKNYYTDNSKRTVNALTFAKMLKSE